MLLPAESIRRRVQELAAEIDELYQGREITAVVALKGGFIFAADLIRCMETPVNVAFVHVRSYGDDTCSSGQIHVVLDLGDPVEDREVLIIEDIVDTGWTAEFLINMLHERGARDVKFCVLLDKPSRRAVDVELDYVGFTVPNVFVVGYGIDYAGQYRGLEDVRVLESD